MNEDQGKLFLKLQVRIFTINFYRKRQLDIDLNQKIILLVSPRVIHIMLVTLLFYVYFTGWSAFANSRDVSRTVSHGF